MARLPVAVRSGAQAGSTAPAANAAHAARAGAGQAAKGRDTASGRGTAAAVKADLAAGGSVFAWGDGKFGQFGTGPRLSEPRRCRSPG